MSQRQSADSLSSIIHTLQRELSELQRSFNHNNFQATVGRAYRGTAMNLVATNWTHIPVNTESFDPGEHISGGNYTVPEEGYYSVYGQVAATIATSAFLIAAIWSGSEISRGDRITIPAAGLVAATVSDIIFFKEGAQIELYGYNSGTEAALEISSGENRLSVIRVA